MKTVILWSSPNTNGLTAEAKNRLLSGLKNSAVETMEVEEIHLNRQKLNHCMACGNGWGSCRRSYSIDRSSLLCLWKREDGHLWFITYYFRK